MFILRAITGRLFLSGFEENVYNPVSPNIHSRFQDRPPNPGRIPPELVDQVIDHLHDDRDTLKTCSMVSCSWLPSSQMHLFHSISVCDPATSFLSFVKQTPHLAGYIRHLRFSPRLKNGRITTLICPLHALPSALSYLPNLSTLELASMCVVCCCGDPVEDDIRPIELDKLILREVASYDKDAKEGILQLLGIFSNVNILDVVYGDGASSRYMGMETEALPVVTVPHFRVQSVNFNSEISNLMLRALPVSPSIGTLRNIYIVLHDQQGCQYLGNLLRSTRVLRDVVFDTCSWVQSRTERSEVSIAPLHPLSTCSHLKSLGFPIAILSTYDASYYQTLCAQITGIIAFAPPTLCDVAFSIRTVGQEIKSFFDVMDWQLMEQLLMKIDGLEKLTFRIATAEPATHACYEEFLVQKLPNVYRGRLQFLLVEPEV